MRRASSTSVGLHKHVIGDIVEIGRRLIEAKQHLGHGLWLPWLEREFQWTEQTARNFMQAYRWSVKNPNFGDLRIGISSIYLLAAPSTPAEVQNEIVKRAEGGEVIKLADVKEVMAEARASTNEAATAPEAGKKRARRTQFEKWRSKWRAWCTNIVSALEELQRFQTEYREDWGQDQDALKALKHILDIDFRQAIEIVERADRLVRATDLRLREKREKPRPTVPAADNLPISPPMRRNFPAKEAAS